MADDPNLLHFGGSDGVLRYVQERSEDIAKAVIPQHPSITITYQGTTQKNVEAGMVLHLLDGSKQILAPTDAEFVLNDGILSRMKIRIELFR